MRGVVKSPTKSSLNVTGISKFGKYQKRIIWLIGQDGALRWRTLVLRTGLDEEQVSRILRSLVVAGALEHVWNYEGWAVYRLAERKDGNDVCER